MASESGIALIEVIVSATLLIILALGTLAVLQSAVSASTTNRSRDVASTLAQADQEHMRQLPLSSIAGGYHPNPAIKSVGGVNYTVSSSGDWTRDASGAVTCSSSSATGRADYLTITSTVTWPAMGSTAPVVMQSIVAPGVAALGGTKGAVAIKLKRANGSPTAGIGVSAGAVSGVTDSAGCVILANLDAGNVNAVWNSAGYVDPDGITNVSKPETIAAGTVAQDNGAYDSAAQVNTNIVDDTGTPQKWTSVSFDQTGMSADRSFTPTPSTPGVSTIPATNLFPFTSAYGMYVGNCAGNDPTTYKSGFTRSSASVTPGTTSSASVLIPSVVVKATNAAGTVVQPNARVSIKPAAVAAMTGCSGAVTVTGNGAGSATPSTYATNSSGTVKVPLPYGIYQVCVDNGTNRASAWTTLNNTPTSDSTPAFSTVSGITGPAVQVPLSSSSSSACP